MKRIKLEHIIAWLLLIILGMIIIHAPLTVAVGSRWPDLYDIARAWKELLMVVAGVLLLVDITRRHAWKSLLRDRFVILAIMLIALHFVLAAIFRLPLSATIAGLMIDLRYIVYALFVYIFIRAYPRYRDSFWRVGILGALIVIGFAILQLFLPSNFLAPIGYSHSTIEPSLTVDKNPNYVRLQSFLRGPNPLGIYALMSAVMVASWWLSMRKKIKQARDVRWQAPLLIGSLIALWGSYSRSAWIGFVVAIALLAWQWRALVPRNIKLIAAGASVVIITSAIVLLQGTSFWHNVVIHDDPTTGAHTTSNQGHAESLATGFSRLVQQPFGAGIGSTGSASLHSDAPIVIENQFLFVAHEIGWLGLALWCWFVAEILRRLWRDRANWQAMGLFASGVGIVVAGLFLPVLTDDTTSIVWFGLAAAWIAKGGNSGTTTHKKAKRTA